MPGPATHNGQKHPLADKRLNLVWLRVPDTAAYSQVADQIERRPSIPTPSVKCETASSGIASFLDAYRDLIWGMRWLLAPACLVSLSLVIANAISISVRERRQGTGRDESARLSAAADPGAGAGRVAAAWVSWRDFVSCGLTWYVVNHVVGGLQFPIAFFPSFHDLGRCPLVGPDGRRPRRSPRQRRPRLDRLHASRCPKSLPRLT